MYGISIYIWLIDISFLISHEMVDLTLHEWLNLYGKLKVNVPFIPWILWALNCTMDTVWH